jgi:glycosyltransferase involved in cell wall biosynthesis
MATVSVIIPSYNRAHTLARALDSVFTQSHPADEVIVVDDGSNDDTKALVTHHYPQAIYLKQANRGVSAARNLGIRQANGEWIALLDSDDEWLPHKLATQLKTLEQQPGHRLIHSDEIWIRNGVRVNPMNKHAKAGGHIFQHCLPLCAISPSAAVIQRSLFDEIGLFDEDLPACEDYDLWLRITACHPVLYCDAPLLVKHGGHEDQLSRQHWGMDRFRIRALLKCLERSGLGAEDHQAAERILQHKLRILLQGAKKHDNQQIIDEFKPFYRADRPAPSTNT